MSSTESRPFPLNPHYRLYQDGRIESCLTRGRFGGPTDTWRPIKSRPNADGYPIFRPKIGGRFKAFKVHQAVLMAWVGPRPAGMLCRHLDGNKWNNRLDNLAWGTPRENTDDAIRLGEIPVKRERTFSPRTINPARPGRGNHKKRLLGSP